MASRHVAAGGASDATTMSRPASGAASIADAEAFTAATLPPGMGGRLAERTRNYAAVATFDLLWDLPE
jgi:hypothetical protein